MQLNKFIYPICPKNVRLQEGNSACKRKFFWTPGIIADVWVGDQSTLLKNNIGG